ncbi:MAG: Rne/Rng family ribonuclease, partial [Bryobacteraceae bacterium]
MPSKELVVSQNRHETKAAILEDGQLVEIYFQRANEYSLAGSIHKGRVTRVLPGMQSAFVDLGLERDCFLYVSDFFEENADEFDRVPDEKRTQDRGRGREPAAAPETPAQAEAAQPAEPRERRSRRTRRRRRSGRGLPESKFATLEETTQETAHAEGGGEAEAETETGPAEEIILLPGESLAKYRRRQEESAQAEAPLTRTELEEAAEEAAEEILDRVEALEHGAPWEESSTEEAAEPEPGPEPEPEAEAAAAAAEEEEAAAAAPG